MPYTDQRERTLTLAQIFQEETDERNPMPLTELMERLDSLELSAERKSLYRDIAALKRHGLEILFRNGRSGGWYVERRRFERQEVGMVLDAVATYRWLSPEQRETLMTKLLQLAPVHQRHSLSRSVVRRQGSAVEPEVVQLATDKIHIALQNNQMLSFVPFSVDGGQGRIHGGRQLVSPKGLIWEGETYYLLAWNHREEAMRQYRVDRMQEMQVMNVPTGGPDMDMSRYTPLVFGPDEKRRERVRLCCQRALAGEVLDLFGGQVLLSCEGEWMYATADVAVNDRFWGWMVAHAENASVVAPPWVAKHWSERYRPRLPDDQKEGNA